MPAADPARRTRRCQDPSLSVAQVVNVRGSIWAVADVRQQGLPRSPADEGAVGLMHVASLQSLEEDRLGQELAVVWELEVGHTVPPDQGLPENISVDAFDDPNALAAFVDAVRWGAVTSADANSFQAPFRSGANVEAYQLEPGVPRPITFDDDAARGRSDLVHIHLGHALMQRCARVLRSALFSVDAPVNRATAVVAEDLPQSCVAAVSRLVLVGRGGLRLHEEVFLTGIRVRGQAMAEAKVEQVLDETLDAPDLVLADENVRATLADLWNTDNSRLRTRLLTAMARKAQTRQEKVTEALQARRDTDIARAREIFGAFRVNLRESRDRLAREIHAEEEERLFTDDQQAQRRRDLRAMEDRLAGLDDEERREIAAIGERYTDIKPHVSPAAVVFALTPSDADAGKVQS